MTPLPSLPSSHRFTSTPQIVVTTLFYPAKLFNTPHPGAPLYRSVYIRWCLKGQAPGCLNLPTNPITSRALAFLSLRIRSNLSSISQSFSQSFFQWLFWVWDSLGPEWESLNLPTLPTSLSIILSLGVLRARTAQFSFYKPALPYNQPLKSLHLFHFHRTLNTTPLTVTALMLVYYGFSHITLSS
jgi:hypothetical protein